MGVKRARGRARRRAGLETERTRATVAREDRALDTRALRANDDLRGRDGDEGRSRRRRRGGDFGGARRGVERGRLLQSLLHALDQSGVFLRIRGTTRAASVVEFRARAARERRMRASRVDGAHQGVALARLGHLRERVRLPDDPACARATARDARDASVDDRVRRSRVSARASGASGRARSSRGRIQRCARATYLARTGLS